MDYRWRDVSFKLPEGLEDETVLVFVQAEGDTVRLNVTVTRDTLGGQAFADYMGAQVDDLKRSLSGYQLVEHEKTTIGGCEAAVLEHTSTSPEGEVMMQRQAYVIDGEEVHIFTATSRKAQEDALRSAFEELIATIKVK